MTDVCEFSSLITATVLVAVAGHYVPATAQVITESNSVYAKNLKGIGIGNGWVDPKLQYGAYSKVYVGTTIKHNI